MEQYRFSKVRTLDDLILIFGVAERANHFEDFAAGGKHTAIDALIVIECVHELDFVVAVVAFAGRWIDLSAA